jgi:aspartate/methionine/tyrosine aminotransferase
MSQPKYQHDFSWGDTRGVRQVMDAELKRIGLHVVPQDLGKFGYPPHEGYPELIAQVRKLIKDLTGLEHKHVLITNGATHGLNAYVYAAKRMHGHRVSVTGLVTRNLYFPFYPQIAAVNGLEHRRYSPNFDGQPSMEDVGIVDSPSNPEGIMSRGGLTGIRVVWDAAYHSPTYCGMEKDGKLVCPDIYPVHEAMVGSLNKLTGINGLRVGWLATNSWSIYSDALYYVETTLCGVSGPSQEYATKILERIDLQPFYSQSKRVLDGNRDELQRLGYLFGGQPIFPYGMFALLEVDDSLKDLFEKASVNVKRGKDVGDERESVRINLANTNESMRAMVDAVLKIDRG